MRHNAGAPSAAFTQVGARRRTEIARALGDLEPQPGQVGALALVGGQPICLDVFDRPSTLARLWRSLLGSYIADALVSRARGEADLEGAHAWLRAAAEAEMTEHAAVGLGRTVAVTGDGVAGGALVVDGAPVHVWLAAIPRRRRAPRGRPSPPPWFQGAPPERAPATRPEEARPGRQAPSPVRS